MGAFYEEIPENIYEWILKQKMLWVATAPLAADGHVNVSPKGGEYFGLIDNKTFWYLDLSGSGVETIAHLHENGRITVMFNAFEGPPRIVRLWGTGRVLECESKAFETFVAEHKVNTIPGTRSIIVVDVHQVGSSCGYSVPFYEFKDFRKTLNQLWEKKEQEVKKGNKELTMARYWAYKSAWSMDGLPGMRKGLETAKKEKVAPITKMVGPHAPASPHGPQSYKLASQLRFRLAKLRNVQVNLFTLIFVVLLAFIVGYVLAATAGANGLKAPAPGFGERLSNLGVCYGLANTKGGPISGALQYLVYGA